MSRRLPAVRVRSCDRQGKPSRKGVFLRQGFGERGSEICQNLVCRVLVGSTLKCRVSLSVILI